MIHPHNPDYHCKTCGYCGNLIPAKEEVLVNVAPGSSSPVFWAHPTCNDITPMNNNIAKFKLKINDSTGEIVQDGRSIGTITRDAWPLVSLKTGMPSEQVIARFKYGTAKRNKAKAWAKFIFERLTVSEVLHLLQDQAPLTLAERLGYIGFAPRQ